ncbi:DeoR/GlpR family DNA-binding transcription regulator [Domibacillus sp. DTU_2020_1001157_1_SI_ALB_TIR_016]|uniref:DeoR/GlpR family DNA-binding transcription regulator n=1 Tax=Domibacillus sp. DTU_2020_1001157_1_SI_ALB_TIR_016 TaxID=3077789 RepID=UPI0028EC550B|nr:DeoR/GlpR family DNA-binding transcription regulator [Domibacillus sp. DTU_2020_1001157_1_SI_ALB_TIR_016]WNS78484.1 DeoR/GlpR family DNA-binding transcription regulator [Domibacillus sp. DTU_2020_1001157_1_SI_ALB_TIR_016]
MKIMDEQKGRCRPMLAEERKLKIIEYIERDGSVRVADLADEFVVSTETVRRYLDELEREQKLKKVYGGAVRNHDKEEAPIVSRETMNIYEKRKIAEKAVQLIQEGDNVFIDEGTTTLQMADPLCRFSDITVMTTSFPLANKLMQSSFQGHILFLGGMVQKEHWRTAGSLTVRMVHELHADKAFIAADGVDEKFGISGYDSDKSVLAKLYMKHSDCVYVLADYSKIEKRATFSICAVDQPDLIITDRYPKGIWSNKNWLVAMEQPLS